MQDSQGRTIDYMRISITDRCNLRCKYCMPEDVASISHMEVLRFEEILRICRLAGELGIRKFKVTGGEPLVRRGCLSFLEELKANDICTWDFLDFAEDILILHGTADEIVPIEASFAFAENNLIEFIPIERADHRFRNLSCMESAMKEILDFFAL